MSFFQRDVVMVFLMFFFLFLFFSTSPVLAWEFSSNLQKGMQGIDVGVLQIKLVWLGFYHGLIDGIFGEMTKEAVKNLQLERGLTPDGVVGPKTSSLLPSLQEIIEDLNQRDILYLAQTINGEARGENLKGQIAVGAVVINRVKDNRFPDTIRDVVLEKGQFTSVWDGQINYYFSESAMKAAQLALLGYDPTGGAFFFYNPRIATERVWITSREVLARIGEHVFAY